MMCLEKVIANLGLSNVLPHSIRLGRVEWLLSRVTEALQLILDSFSAISGSGVHQLLASHLSRKNTPNRNPNELVQKVVHCSVSQDRPS